MIQKPKILIKGAIDWEKKNREQEEASSRRFKEKGGGEMKGSDATCDGKFGDTWMQKRGR